MKSLLNLEKYILHQHFINDNIKNIIVIDDYNTCNENNNEDKLEVISKLEKVKIKLIYFILQ